MLSKLMRRWTNLQRWFPAGRARKRISRKPPLDPLDPQPTTLDFIFFIVFFYSLFIKFGKQYQVNVGSPSATLA